MKDKLYNWKRYYNVVYGTENCRPLNKLKISFLSDNIFMYPKADYALQYEIFRLYG